MSQSSEFFRHKPLCCFSMTVIVVGVYFVIDSVRKFLDTPSYSITYIDTLNSVFVTAVNSASNYAYNNTARRDAPDPPFITAGTEVPMSACTEAYRGVP
jgi:hypothetical protein